MVSGTRSLSQFLYLLAIILLASVASLVGPVYSASVVLSGSLWKIVKMFFTGWSRVLGMVSSEMLNQALLQKNGHPFGKGYTVSAVLGKNRRTGHLNKLGTAIAYILDTIEPGHCHNAALKAHLI